MSENTSFMEHCDVETTIPAAISECSPQRISANDTENQQLLFNTPGGTARPLIPNPFETEEWLEGLASHQNMFSPEMFEYHSPASDKDTSFRWSIEQLAILKPVDLDECPHQADALNIIVDPLLEKRAQEAITAFFEAGNIATSPWSENPPPHYLPGTPDNGMCAPEVPTTDIHTTPVSTGRHRFKRPLFQASSSSDSRRNICTQTELSLPVSFNLKALLESHFDLSNPAECRPKLFRDSDSYGSTSLRRKLFFNGDAGTPPSPVSSTTLLGGNPSDMETSTHGFDSDLATPCKKFTLQQHSPCSGQFSSSPIHRGGLHTPFSRRCSNTHKELGSPLISPIAFRNDSNSNSPMPRHTEPRHNSPVESRDSLPFSPIGGDQLDITPRQPLACDTQAIEMQETCQSLSPVGLGTSLKSTGDTGYQTQSVHHDVNSVDSTSPTIPESGGASGYDVCKRLRFSTFGWANTSDTATDVMVGQSAKDFTNEEVFNRLQNMTKATTAPSAPSADVWKPRCNLKASDLSLMSDLGVSFLSDSPVDSSDDLSAIAPPPWEITVKKPAQNNPAFTIEKLPGRPVNRNRGNRKGRVMKTCQKYSIVPPSEIARRALKKAEEDLQNFNMVDSDQNEIAMDCTVNQDTPMDISAITL